MEISLVQLSSAQSWAVQSKMDLSQTTGHRTLKGKEFIFSI